MITSIGVLVSFLLVTVDLMSFYVLNLVSTKKISFYWIFPMMILYSLELLLFLWGIQQNSMATINLIWSIVSIIGIFVTSILFFNQTLTTIQLVASCFAIISIILFLYSNPTITTIIVDAKNIIKDKNYEV